jgi:hypothetical protein
MTEVLQNQSPTAEQRQICLLGASFETPNMGVSALTAGAIRCFVNRWPDAKVFLFDYGTTTRTYAMQCDGRTVSVPLFNMRFSKKFYLRICCCLPVSQGACRKRSAQGLCPATSGCAR